MSWLPKKKVLVPVDFSPASFEAVREARAMVGDVADLHVLHVLPSADVLEPGFVWGEMTDEKRRERVLEQLKERLSDPDLAGATLEARVGTAGLVIVDYAKQIGAELIVIPSHGYTGLKHLLLGSVAERVVRRAPCPVLVLRRAGA